MSFAHDLMTKKSLIIPIVIAAFCLRFACLDADIPFFVEMHYMDDEGGWSYNARHYDRTGEWTTTSHNAPYYTAPGYSYLLAGVFKANGLSLRSARLLSVVAGTLTVLFLWLFLLHNANIVIANIASTFLALAGFHIIYSRLAMAEAPLTALLMLTLLLWSFKNSRLSAFLAGVFFAVMFILKISAIYFIPVLFLLLIFEILRNEIDMKNMALFAAGVSCVLTLYYVAFVSQNKEEFVYWNYEFPKMMTGGLSPKFFFELFIFGENVEFRHGFFNKMLLSLPVLFILTMMYCVGMLFDVGKNGKRAVQRLDYAEVGALSVLLGNVIVIGLSSYKPERRYLPLLPALAILSAYAIHRGHKVLEIGTYLPPRHPIFKCAFTFALTLPLFVFFCWVLFAFLGIWDTANIGSQKGLSFNGQVFIFLPLYAAGVYYAQKKCEWFKPERLYVVTLALFMSHIVVAWLYFGFLYFGIEFNAVSTSLSVIAIWIAMMLVNRALNEHHLQRIFAYLPMAFLVFQGTIILYTLSFPTYTYTAFGQRVDSIAEGSPVVTDISAPITGHSGSIYYGFPKDRAELDVYDRYFVLSTQKKGNMQPDPNTLIVMAEHQRLPENAMLREVFHLFPFGHPEQYNLIMCLWEIRPLNQ